MENSTLVKYSLNTENRLGWQAQNSREAGILKSDQDHSNTIQWQHSNHKCNSYSSNLYLAWRRREESGEHLFQ